jgi:hypothetical protein
MPSLYDSARRHEIVTRLARLTPDRAPAWGRFTAPQMVAHLTEAYRMYRGELAIPLRPMPLRGVVRRLFIHHLPMPKGAPTAPQLLSRIPTTWDADLGALSAMIDGVRAPAHGATLPVHPIFGPMTTDDWGVLLYKHTDHHLRQFGV